MLVINMMDEARSAGLEIDTEILAQKLGISVLPLVAAREEGLGELQRTMEKLVESESRVNNFSCRTSLILELEFPRVDYGFSSQMVGGLILRDDEEFTRRVRERKPERWPEIEASVEQLQKSSSGGPELEAVRDRNRRARQLYEEVVTIDKQKISWGEKPGRLAARPLTGVDSLCYLELCAETS